MDYKMIGGGVESLERCSSEPNDKGIEDRVLNYECGVLDYNATWLETKQLNPKDLKGIWQTMPIKFISSTS